MRYYQLQCHNTCQAQCSYCPGMGFLSSTPKNQFDLARSLKRAKSGEYSGVLLPCSLIYDDESVIKILTIKESGLTPIVQINSKHLESHKAKIEKWLELGVAVNLIIGNNVALKEQLTRWLGEKSLFLYATLVVHNRLHGLEAFRALPDWLKEEAYFYFPYRLKKGDEFFSPSSICDFLRRFRTQFPGHKARLAPGVDVYDPRIESDLELEPTYLPVYETFIEGLERPYLFSVIIPSYNCRQELLETLKSLFKQNLSAESYEVIVVDDGSDDQTSQSVIDFVHGGDWKVNFKLIYFPRFKSRQMGDARFRAGVARNLGVKNATGKYLAFVDADILVPENYLSTLLKEHKHSDVVQVQRRHLLAEAHSPDNEYWNQFYRKGERWNSMPNGWKYTCTYGLSLPMDTFKQVGWFRKNFPFYGFEDTDLGYRLKKQGCRFHLSSLKVLHQPQRKERSEFFDNPSRRQTVLARTAKIFFHNNLDPEIYQQLRVYMNDQMNNNRFSLKALKNLFSGGAALLVALQFALPASAQELKVKDLQGQSLEGTSMSQEQLENLKIQMKNQKGSDSEVSPSQQKQMLELLNELKGVQESMEERNEQLEKLYNEN